MNKLKDAAELSLNRSIDELPETIHEYEFSDKFNKKSKKLIEKTEDNKIMRLSKKTIAIIVVAAVVLTASIVTVVAGTDKDGFRVKMSSESIEFIVNERQELTDFDVNFNLDGYVLDDSANTGTDYYYSFINEDANSYYFFTKRLPTCGTSESIVNFNRDDSEIIEKNDNKYYCCHEINEGMPESYIVIYFSEGFIYTVSVSEETSKYKHDIYEYLIDMSANNK